MSSSAETPGVQGIIEQAFKVVSLYGPLNALVSTATDPPAARAVEILVEFARGCALVYIVIGLCQAVVFGRTGAQSANTFLTRTQALSYDGGAALLVIANCIVYYKSLYAAGILLVILAFVTAIIERKDIGLWLKKKYTAFRNHTRSAHPAAESVQDNVEAGLQQAPQVTLQIPNGEDGIYPPTPQPIQETVENARKEQVCGFHVPAFNSKRHGRQ